MKLITHERQWRGARTVVALGTFDGVHEGHAQLMIKAKQLARENGLESVVYTFSSHPMATFAPERVPPQLDTRVQRIASIANMGVDAAVIRPFDRAFASLTPEMFVSALVDALHPAHVVIGFNYSFGCKGAGKAQDMAELGKKYGFETHILDAVMIGGEPVSSTRIRGLIAVGDMGQAAQLLGRPYAICGVVVPGKQLGRKLDFPTANLAWPAQKAVPPNGVYAARAHMSSGTYIAAVNIGDHPTAPEGGRTIEANLIDYPGGDCYGKHMRLELMCRLREERRFDSLNALRAEVMKNREQVAAYFAQIDALIAF